jgi:Fur family transcriptional regulator, ferric uptake regulator
MGTVLIISGYHRSVRSTAETEWSDHAVAELRRVGHRRGGARTAIVELLAEQDCCLTAQEIFDRLRAGDRRVGIASVYRALDLLVSLRLVQRIDFGGGVARYEPVHPDGDHHHHLVCGDCGKVVAFEDERLEGELERLAGDLGYVVDGHDVVLRGACGDCAASAAGGTAG